MRVAIATGTGSVVAVAGVIKRQTGWDWTDGQFIGHAVSKLAVSE